MEQETLNNHENPPAAKPLLGDVFLPLLKKFASNDDMREWMATPFNVGSRTVATKGYCLLSTPFQEGFTDRSEKTKTVYPMEHTINKTITVDELKQKLKEFPLIDCFDEIETKCDSCNGDGEVEFEFYHNSKTYEMEHDCPVCDGQGIINTQSKTPNGKKELDYNKFFQIGNCIFNVARVEELIYVADYLKSDVITIVNQTEKNRASLFAIKDVEMLVMPTMCDDVRNVVQNIA